MIDHEVLSMGTEVDSTTLESHILRDFYLTFKLSQGRDKIQKGLYSLLSREYQAFYPSREFAELQSVCRSDRLQERVGKLTMPGPHAVIDEYEETDPKDVFLWEYSQFIKHIEKPGDDVGLSTVQLNIIERDSVFLMDSERLREYSPEDPHKSYYREYVVLGLTTGSRAFDAIFKQMHDLHKGRGRGDRWRFDVLAVSWERLHPGMKFYPDGSDLRYDWSSEESL